MSISSSIGHRPGDHSRLSFLGLTGISATLRKRWAEHRMLRELDSLPAGMMKDLGYPAADATSDRAKTLGNCDERMV